MAAWVACEVWLGAQFQIWAPELGKDTGIWFVTSGLVLFFNFGDASREPRFFQRKVVAALAPIALLEALVDTFILPLPAEILLQPLIAFLVLLAFVAGKEKRQRQVKRLAGALVGMIGLALLGRAAVMTVTGWQELDKTELLLQIALPIWLTLGLLPLHLRRGIRRIVRTSVPAS